MTDQAPTTPTLCPACGWPLVVRKLFQYDETRLLAWCDNDQCGHAELIPPDGPYRRGFKE